MKDVQIQDLIIADINKYLIKERINPIHVDLIQFNGVPVRCEGNLPTKDKIKIEEHLKKYKDKYEIFKLIFDYRFGNATKMGEKLNKNHIPQRFKNFIKTEAELMEIIGAENILRLKN